MALGRTVFKSPTKRRFGQSGTGPVKGPDARAAGAVRRARGAGWHLGQKYDERFMKAIRRMGVPQRSHGSCSRP